MRVTLWWSEDSGYVGNSQASSGHLGGRYGYPDIVDALGPRMREGRAHLVDKCRHLLKIDFVACAADQNTPAPARLRIHMIDLEGYRASQHVAQMRTLFDAKNNALTGETIIDRDGRRAIRILKNQPSEPLFPGEIKTFGCGQALQNSLRH